MKTQSVKSPGLGHKTLIAVAVAGMLTTGGAHAQQEEALTEERERLEMRRIEREQMRVEREERRAEREATLLEIEAARAELAEKARELATLERELISEEQDLQMIVETALDAAESSVNIVIERMTSGELRDETPKLGVLLAGRRDFEVVGLTPGGGAEAAGVMPGDRLLAVNGTQLSRRVSAADALKGLTAGDEVLVLVDRDGEELSFDVTTSESKNSMRFVFEDSPAVAGLGIDFERIESDLEGVEREFHVLSNSGDSQSFSYGFRMPGLFALGGDSEMISNHEGLADYFGTADGILVLKIDPENTLGLLDGDVVLSVEGQEVSRPVDMGRAMLDLEPGEPVRLEVMRDRRMTEVAGQVPESRFPFVAPKPPTPPRPVKPSREVKAPAAPKPPRTPV